MEDDLENDARCPVIRSLSFKLIPANLHSLERLQTPSITPCQATTVVPCFTTRDQKLIYILWMNLFWHMEPISMVYFTRYFKMFKYIIRGNHEKHIIVCDRLLTMKGKCLKSVFKFNILNKTCPVASLLINNSCLLPLLPT